LIVDDFGLRRLSAQQSQDLYELIIERQRRSSFAFASNRGVDEWFGLFDDPILGNSGPGSPGECGALAGDRGLQLPRQAGA
jgi:DNA replication protein DnaC